MPSIAERMAALQASSAKESAAPAGGGARVARDEPTGAKVHAGWLSKAGAGIMSAVFQKRWCVVYADPAMAYYADEACTQPKGGIPLAGATVSVAEDMLQVVANDPKAGKSVSSKFRAESPADAEDWAARIRAARRRGGAAAGGRGAGPEGGRGGGGGGGGRGGGGEEGCLLYTSPSPRDS